MAEKNREKIVPGQVEHRGHDGQALRSVSVRLRAELEAMFSLSQPALYLWLEAPHSDNQWPHLGALAPVHTPRPENSHEPTVDRARQLMALYSCTGLGRCTPRRFWAWTLDLETEIPRHCFK